VCNAGYMAWRLTNLLNLRITIWPLRITSPIMQE